MIASSATLSNYRQAPRKVRLIANLVRGLSVTHALALLTVLSKRGSEPISKLIKSAASNAKDVPAVDLYISKIEVNGGSVFKRSMPRARGKSAQILKRTSHITISLAKKAPKKENTIAK